MKTVLFSIFFVLILNMQSFTCHTIAFKNCSYFKPFSSKKEFKLCFDELICCERPKSENEVCCNPPEYQNWNTVLPVQLTLKNLIFVVFVFFGVIIVGATLITILMGISAILEKQKLYKPVFLYNPVYSREVIQVPANY